MEQNDPISQAPRRRSPVTWGILACYGGHINEKAW